MGDAKKDLNRDIEFVETVEKYKQEIVKNLVNAFNDGYLLGRRHAEQVYSEGKNEN